MKINPRLMVVGGVVAVGLVVGAYQLGQNSDNQAATTTGQLAANGAEGASPYRKVALLAGEGPQASAAEPRFSHFRVGNRNVKSMFADGKYIWVGTSGGVIRYDTETDDYQLYNNKNSGLLSNGIFHISRLGESLVVGTYGGGLALLNTTTNVWSTLNIPEGLADQFVYDVIKAKNGDVWIATWSGTNRVRQGAFDDPSAWQTFTVENTQGGLPNPWVYSVEEGANGDIWFATESGLALYRDGQWQNWQHKDGLGADHELVRDVNQFKNDPGKASSHHARQKQEQGLEGVNDAYNPNYVISMAVQPDGTVWAGTWGAGLSRFDGKQWKTYTSKDGLPANHIFMLYIDKQQQLWIGTSKGLARFDAKTEGFVLKGVADGLYAESVFSMANGQDGSFWVGSFGGVAHIEQGW